MAISPFFFFFASDPAVNFCSLQDKVFSSFLLIKRACWHRTWIPMIFWCMQAMKETHIWFFEIRNWRNAYWRLANGPDRICTMFAGHFDSPVLLVMRRQYKCLAIKLAHQSSFNSFYRSVELSCYVWIMHLAFPCKIFNFWIFWARANRAWAHSPRGTPKTIFKCQVTIWALNFTLNSFKSQVESKTCSWKDHDTHFYWKFLTSEKWAFEAQWTIVYTLHKIDSSPPLLRPSSMSEVLGMTL